MSAEKAELAARLREQAEERLRALSLPLTADGQATRELLHELQVHQIELELQNEELRRMQVDLDASRARYFDLYDLAPVGYLTVSEAGLVQGANLMGATLLGSTRSALLKQPFGRFLAPAEMDAFYLLRRKALADEQRESLELRMVRLDGTEFWAHLAVKTALEDDVRVLRVVLTDVTERKQVEAALRRSEASMRGIVESALDAVMTVDASGCVTEWNQQAELLLGWTRGEAIGQSLTALIIPQRSRAADELGLARPGPGAPVRHHTRSELIVVKKSGQEFPAEVSLSLVLVENLVSYSAFVRDLSERKRADETRSQLEAQLRQAQKLESIGRLAGGVAHDFNNMLTVILGNAEAALAKTEPSAALHADLLEISNAAQRSAELTRQLLAFARKQLIAPVELNLNERLRGLLGMLKRLLGADLALVIKPSDALWPIKMDPAQLDQIILNLCINAREAIAGVGTISIETANCVVDADDCKRQLTARPGDFVRLTVTDTGGGIARGILPLIFEPFFTTKGVGKGVGLGLATVHGAVTQNEGFIEVTSELGLGTTFFVYLPRHRPASGSTLDEPLGLVVGGKETILLVEDEPSILKATARTLEGRGYTVLRAANPEEALALERVHPGEIHLLLSDVIMPSMNGKDLADEVVTRRPQIRCVFMSGYTAESLHGTPTAHFLQKPFTAAELAAKVRSALA